MIALATYAENMRWVAVQQEVPLFDRFSIMKLWADMGTFDLYSATKKLDIAEHVHDCIGRLLADLVIEAAKSGEPPANGRPLSWGRGKLPCRVSYSFYRATRLIAVAALIAPLALPMAARAQSAPPACDAPLDLIRFANPLPRMSQKLDSGEPITIVAIGSSSTAGRRRQFAGRELSEPAAGRTHAALPRPRHHRDQSRRRRRGSRATCSSASTPPWSPPSPTW